VRILTGGTRKSPLHLHVQIKAMQVDRNISEEHTASQDERGMFLWDCDIGFHGWKVLQQGGRCVNIHGCGEN
jgi:hypothetical protein